MSNRYNFPDVEYKESKNSSGVTKRKCSVDKLKAYPFLAYSKIENGVFCVPCRLFPKKGERGPEADQLVTSPYCNWKKFYDKIKTHVGGENSPHAHCVVSHEVIVIALMGNLMRF